MATVSVKIPSELERRISECVENGGYTSKSEFIRDSLRRRVEKLSEEAVNAIERGRKDIEEGNTYSSEEVREELESE